MTLLLWLSRGSCFGEAMESQLMASILCLPAWSGTYTTITYTDPMELKIGSPCFVEVAGLDSHVYVSDIQYSTALDQHVISINFDTPPTQPQMQYPFEAQISDGYCFSAPSFGCTAAAPFPTSVPDFLIPH